MENSYSKTSRLEKRTKSPWKPGSLLRLKGDIPKLYRSKAPRIDKETQLIITRSELKLIAKGEFVVLLRYIRAYASNQNSNVVELLSGEWVGVAGLNENLAELIWEPIDE